MTKNLEVSRLLDSASIYDGMRAIQEGNMGIAFVCNQKQQVVGTLTDGDVRRALLRGESMGSSVAPHMQRQFVSVSPTTSRAEVLDLMRALVINQVPIVDELGRLLGIHLLREIIGASERPNWAVVMAGGEGRRLRPITEKLPKPMVRVAGRPVLERILLHLVGYGLRQIFFSVNYLADVIEGHFGDGRDFGCRIGYLREDIPSEQQAA